MQDCEEVPVLQLCTLSLDSLRALDLNETENVTALLVIISMEGQERALNALMQVRKLLSKTENPPIQSVIDAGGVNLLHELLGHESEQIRFEAAWVITNLLSGTSLQTSSVLKSLRITSLLRLLTTDPSSNIKEQVIWALGNIAGDSVPYRDQVLKAGGLEAILSNLKEDSVSYMRNASWTLANLVRGKPLPDESHYLPILSFISNRLKEESDSSICTDLLWALSYITASSVSNVTDDLCCALVRVLSTEDTQVILPALRTIGNVVAGCDQFTGKIIDMGLFEYLKPLLNNVKDNIRQETCWIISNICAESHETLEKVLSCDLLTCILPFISPSQPTKVKNEAIWTLLNSCDSASLPEKVSFLHNNVLQALISALPCQNEKMTEPILRKLAMVLRDLKGKVSKEEVEMGLNVQELEEKCGDLEEYGVDLAQEVGEALDELMNRDIEE